MTPCSGGAGSGQRCKRWRCTWATGAAKVPGLYVFRFGAGWWTAETPDGPGKGLWTTPRGGRLDLVGPDSASHWTYRVDGDRLTLTLTLWLSAAAGPGRRPAQGGRHR